VYPIFPGKTVKRLTRFIRCSLFSPPPLPLPRSSSSSFLAVPLYHRATRSIRSLSPPIRPQFQTRSHLNNPHTSSANFPPLHFPSLFLPQPSHSTSHPSTQLRPRHPSNSIGTQRTILRRSRIHPSHPRHHLPNLLCSSPSHPTSVLPPLLPPPHQHHSPFTRNPPNPQHLPIHPKTRHPPLYSPRSSFPSWSDNEQDAC